MVSKSIKYSIIVNTSSMPRTSSSDGIDNRSSLSLLINRPKFDTIKSNPPPLLPPSISSLPPFINALASIPIEIRSSSSSFSFFLESLSNNETSNNSTKTFKTLILTSLFSWCNKLMKDCKTFFSFPPDPTKNGYNFKSVAIDFQLIISSCKCNSLSMNLDGSFGYCTRFIWFLDIERCSDIVAFCIPVCVKSKIRGGPAPILEEEEDFSRLASASANSSSPVFCASCSFCRLEEDDDGISLASFVEEKRTLLFGLFLFPPSSK
mmetsp:Transcript_37599/g.56261  ORF Transcript_37599/g.56261 Transcript_37599/m.56261 type:complete len:264 (-) Transcript_37599:462-1253(-)